MVDLTNFIIQTNILFDIGIVVIVSTVLAYFLKIAKQPLIPAYILAGILIGPHFLKLITNIEEIKILAELGIAFLLFMVGLEIDFKRLKDVGFVAVTSGLIEVVLIFTIGFFIALMLGFLGIEAIYLGLVLAFSSTMVVVKLLSDKNEIGTLHGRIILGTLLLQDIIAIFALSILSTKDLVPLFFPIALIKGIGLLLLAILVSKFILPTFFRFAAKSQELLFLSSVTVLFFFSLFAYSIGFSIVIGAFIAGLGLASLPYNFDIAGQIRPLRDFFATLFFVSLGMQVVFTKFLLILLPLLIFVLLVLLLKPLIISFFVSLLGYKKRTSFLTGLFLAQVSEFSLIIAAQGLLLNHISQNVFSLTVLMAVITMGITAYFISQDEKIYKRISKYLGFIERLPTNRERLEYKSRVEKKEILIFGCHRIGSILLTHLKQLKNKLFIVDYDPGIIKAIIKEKIDCMYGDMTNEEVLNKINFKNIKIIISTVPNLEDNLFLVDHVKNKDPKIIVIMTSNYIREAFELYKAKADYVILPRLLGGESISKLLEYLVKHKKSINKIKDKHIHYLLDTKIYGE